MSIDYGFVYFLSNSSMPMMYKIGFTTKHPRLRMVELASSTCCPTPFTLLAYFGAPNPQRVESALHRHFAKYRVNGQREFFHIGLMDIARTVDHFSSRFGDAVFRSELDALTAGVSHEPKPVEVEIKREVTEESRRLARQTLDAAKEYLREICK